MKKLLFLTATVLLYFPVFSQTGILKGRVFDQTSNEPLPFTNIIIQGTTIGSTSDLDGNFLFTGLKPGFIRLVATSVGYDNVLTEEIQVTNAKTVYLDIPMVPRAIQLKDVEVKSSIFKRVEESPVSLKSIGISQIEKSPGANRDISKVIQNLPGVASTVSFRNDIIVRGGGPAENRFYLDGMEIPNLNHFATQGASGGPVGILNTDFLREVDFYSGAFPSSRGNTLSSVLDMKLIDGNPDKPTWKFTVGASEMAFSSNGPAGEKTRYLFSVRQSYLQFIFGAIGLPFLPTFNDYTLKVKTKLDLKNEITILSIGALDRMKLNTGIENPTEDQQYILDYLPVNNQWNYAIGAVYRHFRTNSVATLVLSRNMLDNEAFKYENNDESLESNLNLKYNSQEIENKIRYEEVLRLKSLKITYGAGAEYAKYNNNTFQRVFIPRPTDTLRQLTYNSDLAFFKWNIFGQVSKGFIDERLTLSVGIRTDANNYSSEMSDMFRQFSPRFSASYSVTDKFRLNFNTGRYFQLPAYTMLGYRNAAGELVNKANGIRYINANHIVAGLEYQPQMNTKITLEGFYKTYNYYPFSVKDSVSIASKGADFGVTGAEEIVSTNKGRAAGLELYYRDRPSEWLDITLSYTFVRSSFVDKKGNYIPSSWDNRHLLNTTVLAKLKRNWEVGARWRYAGGSPYTPYDLEFSSLKSAWDVQGQGYLDYNRFNELRLKGFHQLDIRVDKEYFFKSWSLNFYLDIQNAYNFKSQLPDVLLLQRDSSGNPVVNESDPSRYELKFVENESGTVLPTIGIIVEF